MNASPLSFELYYASADEDEVFLEPLEQHLSLLQRTGLTISWHKRRIPPGADWHALLDSHLHSAPVILLLVSPAFLASNFCYHFEMQQAMRRQQQERICVIPLLLRPVDWQAAPFAHLEVLPSNRKPVTSWSNQDEAFLDITQGIRTILTKLCADKDISQDRQEDIRLYTPLTAGSTHKNDNRSINTLKERFEGAEGYRLLKEALMQQKMIVNHVALAEEIAHLVEVQSVKAGEVIIQQGGAENDLFFILSGSFNILVNGKIIARRSPHEHVGEMAAIDPSQPRSATVVANEDAVVGKLSEARLAHMGQRYPDIWRSLARELVRRLTQRNLLMNSPGASAHLSERSL